MWSKENRSHVRCCLPLTLIGVIACGAPAKDEGGTLPQSGQDSTGVAADESATTPGDDANSGFSSDSTGADGSSGGGEGTSGGGSTSTGSGEHDCLPSPLPFDALPSEVYWFTDDNSVTLDATLGDGAAFFGMWLVEGIDPFADGFAVGEFDLSDASFQSGAGLTLSEMFSEEEFRLYLPVKGTLYLDVVEEPADGSRITGRLVGVTMREYDEVAKELLADGCGVELMDMMFDVTLMEIGGGSESGAPPPG